jgi:hypothetical protein
VGEKCLAAHVEEQRATLAELVSRMNINPSIDSSSSSEGGLRAVGGELLKNIAGRLNLVGSTGGKNLVSSALLGKSDDANANNDAAAGLVVKHLERLSGQWKGVLQDVVYDRVVSV